jgi:hypothetical protein
MVEKGCGVNQVYNQRVTIAVVETAIPAVLARFVVHK